MARGSTGKGKKGGQTGRPKELHSRPPLDRMMQIHESIKRGNYPNATTLAGKLEVTTKTIHRDIRFMRDRWELPIEFDAAYNGYKYTRDVDSFPMLKINEGELFALLIAEKALQNYRGTVFEKRLSGAFQKIADSLPDTVNIHLNEWSEALSFHQTSATVMEVNVFDRICQAAAKRKQLTIVYTKPNQKPEQRLIDPYQVANINNEWYLYAYDHLRKDIRCFVPARIEKAETTGKLFDRPADFSLTDYLAGSFGVFTGEEAYQVRVRFSKTVAPFIRERQWHPTQELKNLKNGGLELSLKLSHLIDFRKWILGWGGEAKVLEPPELVEMVKTEAQAILDN